MTTRAEMAEFNARSVQFSRSELAAIGGSLRKHGTKQSVKLADRIDNHLAWLRRGDVLRNPEPITAKRGGETDATPLTAKSTRTAP